MTKLARKPLALINLAITLLLSFNIVAAPNNVYVNIDGHLGTETVSISESASEGVVYHDDFLETEFATFDWDSVGATLGHIAAGESFLGIRDTIPGASLRGAVKAGWTANYVALGSGVIDLDIDFVLSAFLTSSIIRETATSSANVSYVATLDTGTTTSIFNGSAELRVYGLSGVTLIETGDFIGRGVVEEYCLPCSADTGYAVDFDLENKHLFDPGDVFSITVEAIAKTEITVEPDVFFDLLEASVNGVVALRSSNPSASFSIVEPAPLPLPATVWLFGFCCCELLRRHLIG